MLVDNLDFTHISVGNVLEKLGIGNFGIRGLVTEKEKKDKHRHKHDKEYQRETVVPEIKAHGIFQVILIVLFVVHFSLQFDILDEIVQKL